VDGLHAAQRAGPGAVPRDARTDARNSRGLSTSGPTAHYRKIFRGYPTENRDAPIPTARKLRPAPPLDRSLLRLQLQFQGPAGQTRCRDCIRARKYKRDSPAKFHNNRHHPSRCHTASHADSRSYMLPYASAEPRPSRRRVGSAPLGPVAESKQGRAPIISRTEGNGSRASTLGCHCKLSSLMACAKASPFILLCSSAQFAASGISSQNVDAVSTCANRGSA
jgi:hypothetical protein